MKVFPLIPLALCFNAWANDLETPCASRMAIERVYYQHRLGQKPPFEQVSPPALIERLVKADMRKEAVLKQAYSVEVTPELLGAEVKRINTTTHAPDMLREIKAALGNDPAKFAAAFAKPFLVERLLRDKFENDDALHRPQRRECERIRNGLITARTKGATPAQLLAQLKAASSNTVSEAAWQLAARPAETNASAADEREIKKRFGPDARLLSPPHAGSDHERKMYFEDLPEELQKVLRAQLRQPGDVTAVIEAPGGFLLYLAKTISSEALNVAGLSLPKRSYEQWLNEQSENKP